MNRVKGEKFIVISSFVPIPAPKRCKIHPFTPSILLFNCYDVNTSFFSRIYCAVLECYNMIVPTFCSRWCHEVSLLLKSAWRLHVRYFFFESDDSLVTWSWSCLVWTVAILMKVWNYALVQVDWSFTIFVFILFSFLE